MESLGMAGRGGDIASSPAIGFPLGSALLLLVIFCLSSAFSCCYHWGKLKTYFPCCNHSIPAASFSSSPMAVASPCNSFPLLQVVILPFQAPKPTEEKLKGSSSLPVVMPGDSFPKYIAWPCRPSPRAQPKDNISMQVHCHLFPRHLIKYGPFNF